MTFYTSLSLFFTTIQRSKIPISDEVISCILSIVKFCSCIFLKVSCLSGNCRNGDSTSGHILCSTILLRFSSRLDSNDMPCFIAISNSPRTIRPAFWNSYIISIKSSDGWTPTKLITRFRLYCWIVPVQCTSNLTWEKNFWPCRVICMSEVVCWPCHKCFQIHHREAQNTSSQWADPTLQAHRHATAKN